MWVGVVLCFVFFLPPCLYACLWATAYELVWGGGGVGGEGDWRKGGRGGDRGLRTVRARLLGEKEEEEEVAGGSQSRTI